MTLVEHAKAELARINEDQNTINGILKVVQAFADGGHSGGSAPMAIDYLEKLLRFEPLSPLTSDPAEWIDRSDISGYPIWQSSRDPRAFSYDGGKTWGYIREQEPDPEQDLDNLTRDQLAELSGPAAHVAAVLDEWLHRLHGVTSSSHGAGLFLDLLAARGAPDRADRSWSAAVRTVAIAAGVSL